MKDRYEREINYLRISLTEKCNLRCIYCLPEDFSLKFSEKENNLSLENVLLIVKIAKELGINKIRFTGGEPLLRKDIISIISGTKNLGIDEIYLTTNGILLEEKVKELVDAGLKGINVSLDSLKKDRFNSITRGGDISKVLNGIKKAYEYGLKVKINSVILKNINEEDIQELSKITLEKNIDLRFIELMPIGEGKKFKGLKSEEIYTKLKDSFKFDKSFFQIKGVAKYYRLEDGKGKIGFITPINNCFCETCNKIRITSTGEIKGCLNKIGSKNIKEYLDKKDIKSVKEILIKEIFEKPKKHYFGENSLNEEIKYMNQIGG